MKVSYSERQLVAAAEYVFTNNNSCPYDTVEEVVTSMLGQIRQASRWAVEEDIKWCTTMGYILVIDVRKVQNQQIVVIEISVDPAVNEDLCFKTVEM